MNLYHYPKVDTAIKFILPYKELRMNQAKYMNDPKENLLIKSEFWSYGHKCSIDEALIAQIAGEETKILSFCIDDPIIKNRLGYKNHKMWWHYADSNSGICLEIDYDEFIKENKPITDEYSIIQDSIKYDKYPFDFLRTPLIGQKKESDDDINLSLTPRQQWDNDKSDLSYIHERFFTKHSDWANENEYRFLTISNDNNICLSIEQSLKTVYLGLLFNNNYFPSIEKIITCKIEKIDLFNGELIKQ